MFNWIDKLIEKVPRKFRYAPDIKKKSKEISLGFIKDQKVKNLFYLNCYLLYLIEVTKDKINEEMEKNYGSNVEEIEKLKNYLLELIYDNETIVCLIDSTVHKLLDIPAETPIDFRRNWEIVIWTDKKKLSSDQIRTEQKYICCVSLVPC